MIRSVEISHNGPIAQGVWTAKTGPEACVMDGKTPYWGKLIPRVTEPEKS